MKHRLIAILLVVSCALAKGQRGSIAHEVGDTNTTRKAIAISTDAVQYVFNQPNINIEYVWKRFSAGLNIGIIRPDPAFAVNVLSNGQYLWPGTVYHGIAFRLSFKYFDMKHQKRYWGAFLVCKPEWYKNVSFYDMTDPTEETGVDYTMNENATVLGIELVRGHELGYNNAMHIDFFYGLGFHDKLRNFTVTSMSTPTGERDGSGILDLGNYKGSVSYLTPVLGLKFGLNYLFKK